MGTEAKTLDEIFAMDPADARSFIDAMVEHLEEQDGDDLNDSEAAFMLLAELERELDDGGGFSEWFYAQGYNAQDVVQWLDELQAQSTAILMRRAMSPFAGGVAPRDEGELELALRNLSDGEEEIWEELDQEYAEENDGEFKKTLVTFCFENKSDFS